MASVIIGSALGGVFSVRLDPPLDDIGPPTCRTFDEAAGWGVSLAANLGLRLLDETGHLTPAECNSAVQSYAAALGSEQFGGERASNDDGPNG